MIVRETCAIWGAVEDDMARGVAYGDGAYRSIQPLRGVHGRVYLSDHARRRRVEADAAVRDEDLVSDCHDVRAEVHR